MATTAVNQQNNPLHPRQASLAELRAQVPVHMVPEILKIQVDHQQIPACFVKTFDVKSFGRNISAYTLDADEVDEQRRQGEHQRTHEDGWTIRGCVNEDWCQWVNDFEAHHPVHGWVCGNFESAVYASSQETYDLFFAAHSPSMWNYQDI